MKIFSYNRNFAIFTILAMVLLVLGCGKEAGGWVIHVRSLTPLEPSDLLVRSLVHVASLTYQREFAHVST